MTSPSPKKGRNPLAFQGLKRVKNEEDGEIAEEDMELEEDPEYSPSKIELNRRGLPARKRKRNSLIFGGDDVVTIPVKSPKKRANNQKVDSRPGSEKKRAGSNANTPKNNARDSPATTPVATVSTFILVA